ncbi:MAG: pyridoxamine 5'-phosphate oxidase family protein [Candidatus Dormibacteraeota bacterium]|nr:pyridoxamine 5'-phosphate oxidase family protein [Candidatus Dormibacteraeota bacterium]
MNATRAADDRALERALWSLRAYDAMALATTGEDGPQVAGVFFAPEVVKDGIRLIIATLGDTLLHRSLQHDPHVAFLCSPGNASRWVQGTGVAELVDDPLRHADLHERLMAHAPGARAYVERFPMVPALINVRRLKIVEAIDAVPLLVDLSPDSTPG